MERRNPKRAPRTPNPNITSKNAIKSFDAAFNTLAMAMCSKSLKPRIKEFIEFANAVNMTEKATIMMGIK